MKKLTTTIMLTLVVAALPVAAQTAFEQWAKEATLNNAVKQTLAEHVKVRDELAEAYKAATKGLKEAIDILEKPNANQTPGFKQKMAEVVKRLEALAAVAERDELITLGMVDARDHLIRHLMSGNIPVEEIKSRLARLVEPTKKKDEVAEDKLALAQMSFLVELDRLAVLEAQLRSRRK